MYRRIVALGLALALMMGGSALALGYNAVSVINVSYVENIVTVTTAVNVSNVRLTTAYGLETGAFAGIQILSDCVLWSIDVKGIGDSLLSVWFLLNGQWYESNYRVKINGSGIVGPPTPYVTSTPYVPPVPYVTPTPSSGKPWDSVVLIPYSASTPDRSDERISSRSGPAVMYTDTGSYKKSKIVYIGVFFTESIGSRNWVYTELLYQTGYKRRIYFLASALRYGNLPAKTLTGVPARLLYDTTPLYGPGTDYDLFGEATIRAGTPLTVFFEENGYVFAEFIGGAGLTRAWIPAYNVEPEQFG